MTPRSFPFDHGPALSSRRRDARAVPLCLAPLGLLGALALGCETSRPAEPSASASSASSVPAPSPASPASTPAPQATKTAAALTWTAPSSWQKEPKARPMRVATYRVGSTDPAELAIFHFGPGDGGGVELNIERWIGQFSGIQPSDVVRTERRASSGLAMHVVEIPKGTYASGMPGGPTTPRENFGLLGAIVETPGGSYFFKLTGPAETLAQERERFLTLLDSVRVEG